MLSWGSLLGSFHKKPARWKLSVHRGGQRQLLLQPLDPATWNANLAYVECMWAVVNLSRLTRGLRRDTSEISWRSDGYHRRYGKRQAKSRPGKRQWDDGQDMEFDMAIMVDRRARKCPCLYKLTRDRGDVEEVIIVEIFYGRNADFAM